MRVHAIGALVLFAAIGAGCARPATAPPAAPVPPPAENQLECAIVAWSCTCSYECRQVWNGDPGPTCANARPSLDDPATREPPPQRPCGVVDGACAYLDWP